MNYQEQTIAIKTGHYNPTVRKGQLLIPTDYQAIEIPALVAEGVGLAIHQEMFEHVLGPGYVITHLASGLRIGGYLEAFDSEEEAKRVLELVAPLIDWNRPAEEVHQDRKVVQRAWKEYYYGTH